MNDDQRRGLIEGLRLTREAIDKRLDELERRLERGDDVLGEALIRREELRAAKEGYAGVCRGAGISPPLRTIDGYVAIDRCPPDGEGQWENARVCRQYPDKGNSGKAEGSVDVYSVPWPPDNEHQRQMVDERYVRDSINAANAARQLGNQTAPDNPWPPDGEGQ